MADHETRTGAFLPYEADTPIEPLPPVAPPGAILPINPVLSPVLVPVGLQPVPPPNLAPAIMERLEAQAAAVTALIEYFAQLVSVRLSEQQAAIDSIKRRLALKVNNRLRKQHRQGVLPVSSALTTHRTARLAEQETSVQRAATAVQAASIGAGVAGRGETSRQPDALGNRPGTPVPSTFTPGLPPQGSTGAIPAPPKAQKTPERPLQAQKGTVEARTSESRPVSPEGLIASPVTLRSVSTASPTVPSPTPVPHPVPTPGSKPPQAPSCQVGLPPGIQPVAVYLVPWLDPDTATAGVDSECGEKLISDAWGQRLPAQELVDALAQEDWITAYLGGIKSPIPSEFLVPEE